MSNNSSAPIDIADYDASQYDYQKYWYGREYEHASDLHALSRLLPDNARSLIDLGGGYGRLSEAYSHLDTQVVCDYSQHLLDCGKEHARRLGNNHIAFVKGNLYHLPFNDTSFDVACMVRVIHHLDKPEHVISEVHRVLRPGGVFILEFANKLHFKARVRFLVKGQIASLSDMTPYQQPHLEGIDASGGIFLNFHPQYISHLLGDCGFTPEMWLSVSNFRSPTLKRYIPLPILLASEYKSQRLLAPLYFGPSIYVLARKSL